MLLIWWFNSASNCREMALRVVGRFSERIRMLPQCGAGTVVTVTAGACVVAYAHRWMGRRSSRGESRRRGIV